MVKRRWKTGLPGEHSAREPPDPIPNSEVKLRSADDSAASLWCESRSSPGFYTQTPAVFDGGGFLFVAPDTHNADMNDIAALKAELGSQAKNLDIQVFESVGSTSQWLAEHPPRKACLVWARQQTRGRGRMGRTWHSPPGGVYFSVGWPLESEAPVVGSLPLLVGLSVAEALRTHHGVPVQLKWPNDLVVNGAKLGGILVEKQRSVLVVGVGINAAAADVQAADLGRPATGLQDIGGPVVNAALVGQLACGVLDSLTTDTAVVRASLPARWAVLDALAGHTVAVDTGGPHPVCGRVLGITPQGLLRLTTAQGERHINAGECRLQSSPEPAE